MKKILLISFLSLAMACGGSSDRAENQDEAAADESVDPGAGEEISPQLELDSSDRRFEVDTVSSPGEINDETEKESF